MLNMVRMHSSLFILRKKVRNISWNRWTARITARFIRTSRALTRIFRCVLLNLVLFAVMSRVVSCMDWLVCVVLHRMMRIFSAVRTRWKMNSSVWWILSLLYSVLWTSRILKLRYHCVIKWTVRNISVAMIIGRRRNKLLLKLVKKKDYLPRLNMVKLLSMALSSTLW